MAKDGNATATWSGYNHQGKVGLFVALREMASLAKDVPRDSITVDHFGEWYIEFERSEDFDICMKPPCSDPAYLHSRHQVKAYPGKDGKKISDYREVLLSQSKEPAKSGKHKGEYTPYRGFKVEIQDEQGAQVGCVPVERRYIHLVQDVEDWSDSGDDNTYEVHRYHYSVPGGTDRPYCDLSNSANEGDEALLPLDIASQDVIKAITGMDDSKAKLIWQSLQAWLTNEIATCHNTSSSLRPKLTFQDIFDKFLQNNADLSRFLEDYRADIFRRRLINLWAKIQSRYEDTGSIDAIARNRIDAWLGELHKKDNEELRKYIDSLSPNEQIKPNDIHQAGFSEVVCATIKQVGLTPLAAVHEYLKNGMPYSLTMITDDPASCASESLHREISEAIDVSGDSLYQQCTLVTKNHDFDFLESRFTDQLEYGNKSLDVKAMEIAKVRVPNVEGFQPRRVISVANAVIELNEESP